MLTAYLIALSFGAVLVGASLLLGDADAEADHDIEMDHDIDVDHDIEVDHVAAVAHGPEGESNMHLAGDAAHGLFFNPFFSIRFWTYFATSFGGVGTGMYFLGASSAIHPPVAIGMGFVTGYGVSLAFRLLKSSAISSETSTKSLVGSEASVILDIPEGGKGKIRVRFGEQDADFLASCGTDIRIERGETVLIVATDGDCVRVEPLSNSLNNEIEDRSPESLRAIERSAHTSTSRTESS